MTGPEERRKKPKKEDMKTEERIYRHSETSEKALERRLVEQAKARGCMAVKMCDVNCCGMPDRLILMPDGGAVFAEVKSYGKKPTALQESRIAKLRKMGFTVVVIDSTETLDEFLKLLDVFVI